MINVERASKWYGQVIGVNDVSCAITPGVTALLGQNGAGKSTLIKMVTGQLKPTTGRVSVFGKNPFANSAVHARMGYCPETDSFYEEMTGRDFVILMARMAGIESSAVRSAADAAIARVGMTPRAGDKIAAYSKGMRQRIKLAQAIAHDPDVLILDEPLSGLDPVGRREMTDLLKDLALSGKCILISSHILHEVEQMTRSIVLLHRGRLLAIGDVRQIRSLIDRHPHKISIEVAAGSIGARGFAKQLLSMPSVLSLTFSRDNPEELQVETTSPDEFYGGVAELVLETRTELRNLYSPDNNLEAVYQYLVKG